MRKVSFLLIIILFLIANVTFATEPHGVAYIKLEARQNIKKNEIILYGTIILPKTAPDLTKLEAGFDVVPWGLRKVSGESEKVWWYPKKGKKYTLQARYRIISPEYKFLDVGLSVFGEQDKFRVQLLPIYYGRIPGQNQEEGQRIGMVLKYQQQGIPLCGLETIPPPKGPYVKHFYETCTRVET
jgi:hypothetical protein